MTPSRLPRGKGFAPLLMLPMKMLFPAKRRSAYACAC